MPNLDLSDGTSLPPKQRPMIDMPQTSHPPRKIAALVYLALAVMTIAVFWQVPSFDFINLDDNHYVINNVNVHAGVCLASIKWAFTTDHGGLYVPITWISLMLDEQLYGLNPGGFHLTNLLLHIANTLLLFTVLRRMTGALWRSAFVAALFAVHPLHVESVAWITERKDVLSTFFMMLTLMAYGSYARKPRVPAYVMVVSFFMLGLLSKPMLVTLPLALLLLDYWPLVRLGTTFSFPTDVRMETNAGRPFNPSKKPLQVWLEKLPMLTLSALVALLTIKAAAPYNTRLSFDVLPFKTRAANALVSYTAYIRKMVWPNDLAVFYPHPGENLPWQAVVVSGLILTGLTVLALSMARRKPFIPVGWFWFLGTLVPVIGLTQAGLQGMADRFTYIPLIGLFIVIAWGAEAVYATLARTRMLIPLAGGIVLAAAMVTSFHQVAYWRDSITLFSHALTVTRANYLAHNNLANARLAKGEIEAAIRSYKQAVQVNPRYANGYFNLGRALAEADRPHEAIAVFNRLLEIHPSDAEGHYHLGRLLLGQNRVAQAEKHFALAIRFDPQMSQAHFALGNIHLRTGHPLQAVKDYRLALRSNPNMAATHYNLATAYLHLQKYSEAEMHFKQALRLKPGFKRAQAGLRSLRSRLSREAKNSKDKAPTN